MYKKILAAISALTIGSACICGLSGSAAYEDYTEEELEVLISDMRKYAAQIEEKGDSLGYSTDRYSFANGKYHPVHSESDLNWQEYAKRRSNIEAVTVSPDNFFDCNSSGRCVGMTLTSVLAHNGVISPSDIQEGKDRLIDIKATTDFQGIKTDKAMQKVISYQSRQLSPDFRLKMYCDFSHYDREKGIDRLLETARKATSEGKWFFMAYEDENLCHAVTGMGLTEGEFVLGGKKYDSCILTYDSNFEVEDKSTGGYVSPAKCAINGCIFINSATHDLFVPAYFMDDCGSDFKVFTLDDDDFMNYRGMINPGDSYKTDVSNLSCVEIRSSAAYAIEDDLHRDVIAGCGKTYKRAKKTAYYCDRTDLTVKNTGNSAEFSADLTDTQRYFAASFSGSVDTICKTGSEFGFSTLGETKYDITLAFEEGTYAFTPHFRYDFSGITDSDLRIEQTDRGIVVSSSDGVQCTLRTSDVKRENGFLLSAEENIRDEGLFTKNSVLIAFDGDIPRFYIGENYGREVRKGDVNCDGSIDAADASAVLQGYSALSTGETCYLSKSLADWNGDGSIDSADASAILQKYAELSTSKQ